MNRNLIRNDERTGTGLKPKRKNTNTPKATNRERGETQNQERRGGKNANLGQRITALLESTVNKERHLTNTHKKEQKNETPLTSLV